MKKRLSALTRLCVAILTTAALFWVVVTRARNNPDYSFANLFSYYTIQSNIIVILVLVVVLATRRSDFSDRLRGAATLYIVITGVIYHLLLSGVDVQLQTNWINLVLHTITPAYMLFDWLLNPPACKIPIKRSLVWLSYPAAYAAYTLVRGEITGWYPYPFTDAAAYGYARIILNFVIILLGFMVLALGVAVLPRLTGKLKPSSSSIG